MKETIKLFLKANRGGLMLLAIVLVVTAISALIFSVCGAGYATVLVASECFGLLSIMLVSTMYKIASESAPMGAEWGMLGMIISLLLTMLVY